MIQLDNVSKIYKNKSDGVVYALKNCNLTLPTKSFIMITGKSGSGKTTLINMFGSLDTPSEGDIMFEGVAINEMRNTYRNEIIGFIFQEHNLFNFLTVKENIKYVMELQGKDISDDAIITTLKKLSLEDCIDKYPYELSTGQKQRVAIARALIKSPKIIIADEPTGSLDEKNSHQVLQILKDLSKEYIVIMVTHNTVYPKLYADRHITLDKGVIVRDEIFHEVEYESSKNTISKNDDYNLNNSIKNNIVKK